jgi:hypothetical protein
MSEDVTHIIGSRSMLTEGTFPMAIGKPTRFPEQQGDTYHVAQVLLS